MRLYQYASEHKGYARDVKSSEEVRWIKVGSGSGSGTVGPRYNAIRLNGILAITIQVADLFEILI